MEDNIYKISYKLKKELHHKILMVIITIVSLFLFLTLFMNFVIFPVMQKSVSMSPTLANPTVSFVCPFLREPKRGDLMFLKPQQRPKLSFSKKFANSFIGFFTGRQFFPYTTTTSSTGTGTIRRVVGLPGDTIFIDDYILHIKPKGSNIFLSEFELTEKNYSIKLETVSGYWDGQMGSLAKMDEIVLGDDEYFVLGDNRNICSDSRTWGTIKSSRFNGKVLLTYLPVSHFKAHGF